MKHYLGLSERSLRESNQEKIVLYERPGTSTATC